MKKIIKLEVPQKDTHKVYNNKNKPITEEFINNILETYGIEERVNKLENWQQAFVHHSYCKMPKMVRKNEFLTDKLPDEMELADESYESLEFLGDGYLQIASSTFLIRWLGNAHLYGFSTIYLKKRYPELDEGWLTTQRSKLIRTDSLANFSKILGFNEYLIVSDGYEIDYNARNNPRFLEDCFEAFLGAMANDLGGYAPVEKFVHNFFDRNVDMAKLISTDTNYKTKLINYYSSVFQGNHPVYDLISKEDTEGNTFYKIAIHHPVTKELIAEGKHRHRKNAEQECARLALIKFTGDC